MKWEKIIKRHCGCGKDPCETYGEIQKGKGETNEEIEKLFGRNKQPQQLTRDGINFTDQRALDIYNQNIQKYPNITNNLTGQTVNASAIETAIDNAARTQITSQAENQKQMQSLQNRPKTTKQPSQSAWRRPAY
jgi:hypothetical protein